MLLYYAHPHYHTAPLNRQQLQGKVIIAQDVPYSRGTHNGNSMANTAAHCASTHSETNSQSYDEIQIIHQCLLLVLLI